MTETQKPSSLVVHCLLPRHWDEAAVLSQHGPASRACPPSLVGHGQGYKKAEGQAAKLCHMGHVLMENRSCLVVAASTTLATGTAEREAAVTMVGALSDTGRITLGMDKAYDTADFLAEMRRPGVTPHVAQNDNNRRSAIDGRHRPAKQWVVCHRDALCERDKERKLSQYRGGQRKRKVMPNG